MFAPFPPCDTPSDKNTNDAYRRLPNIKPELLAHPSPLRLFGRLQVVQQIQP